MKLMTIASGSSGNSCFIGTDRTSLLLDTGISLKNIEKGLADAEISPKDLDGVLITHEHSDHIKGLGVLLRKYNIPVYGTYGTIDGIMATKSLGVYDYNLLSPIKNEDEFEIGDIRVAAHPVSHDANDPVCFSFTSGERKVAVATDMGVFDDSIVDFLQECDAMVIEANHDVRMLEVGPYPYMLKRRILGDRGHLCNEASGYLIRQLLNDHLKYIALGHLSDKNNYAELAFETVKQELLGNPYTEDVRDFGLCVAPRYETGELIEV